MNKKSKPKKWRVVEKKCDLILIFWCPDDLDKIASLFLCFLVTSLLVRHVLKWNLRVWICFHFYYQESLDGVVGWAKGCKSTDRSSVPHMVGLLLLRFIASGKNETKVIPKISGLSQGLQMFGPEFDSL